MTTWSRREGRLHDYATEVVEDEGTIIKEICGSIW